MLVSIGGTSDFLSGGGGAGPFGFFIGGKLVGIFVGSFGGRWDGLGGGALLSFPLMSNPSLSVTELLDDIEFFREEFLWQQRISSHQMCPSHLGLWKMKLYLCCLAKIMLH